MQFQLPDLPYIVSDINVSYGSDMEFVVRSGEEKEKGLGKRKKKIDAHPKDNPHGEIKAKEASVTPYLIIKNWGELDVSLIKG